MLLFIILTTNHKILVKLSLGNFSRLELNDNDGAQVVCNSLAIDTISKNISHTVDGMLWRYQLNV